MQQRFGRDATEDTAQLGVTLDQDDFESQICSAEGSRIAAGAGTEHQQIAIQIDAACVAGGSGDWGGRAHS